MRKNKILIVDDEQDILEFTSYNFKKENFDVRVASNGKEAIDIALGYIPDLILLDVMMPEFDGIEVCEHLRTIPSLSETIIVFLSARGEDYSQIAGFNAGADDYIKKPIKPKLLISRIKALLKRHAVADKFNFAKKIENEDSKGLVIDRERYIVITDGKEMYLPKKEFNLLSLLNSKPGRVFTRDQIFDFLWKGEVIVNDRTIDVYIRKIREKIGVKRIKTIKGVGYKYVV